MDIPCFYVFLEQASDKECLQSQQSVWHSVTKYVKADVANTVSIVVTVVGIVISCVDIVKNVFNNREE